MNFFPQSRAALLAAGLICFSLSTSQSKPEQNSSAPPAVTAEYPADLVGVLVDNSGWIDVPNASPAKTKVKHGVAHALTSGAVPASTVSIYSGEHAQVQIQPGRPVLCLCHVFSLPGAPVLVRLHSNKDTRELDGGRLPIIGARVSEAKENDLIAVDVSQPENGVWLLRPRNTLTPGEYALMLGTQNMSIFPFTVAPAANESSQSAPSKP